MKRNVCTTLLALLLFAAVLAGCGDAESGKDTRSALLEFPATHWMDSPDAVKAALSIRDEDAEVGEDTEQHTFTILWHPKDCKLFGETATAVVLRFYDGTETGYKLCSAAIHYPEGTQMDTVRKAIRDYYGTPEADKVPLTTMDIFSNTTDTSYRYGNQDTVAAWISGKTYADILTESEQAALLRQLQDVENSTVTAETLDAYLRGNPAVTITWDTEVAKTAEGDLPDWVTANAVFFTANTYVTLKDGFIQS